MWWCWCCCCCCCWLLFISEKWDKIDDRERAIFQRNFSLSAIIISSKNRVALWVISGKFLIDRAASLHLYFTIGRRGGRGSRSLVLSGRRSGVWFRCFFRFSLPGLYSIFSHRERSIHTVEFEVQSTSVTHRFTLVVAPPKGCRTCATIRTAQTQSSCSSLEFGDLSHSIITYADRITGFFVYFQFYFLFKFNSINKLEKYCFILISHLHQFYHLLNNIAVPKNIFSLLPVFFYWFWAIN